MIEESSKKTVVEESQSKTTAPQVRAPRLGGPIKIWKVLVSTWSSRKLWMTIFSTMIVYGTYWHTINHLYTMDSPDKVGALSTMYIGMLSVLGVIVATYLGTNAIASKFNVTSAASILSQTLTEKRDDTETRNENINIKEESTQNFNYREYIVEEGVNTDKVKPYAALASEE